MAVEGVAGFGKPPPLLVRKVRASPGIICKSMQRACTPEGLILLLIQGAVGMKKTAVFSERKVEHTMASSSSLTSNFPCLLSSGGVAKSQAHVRRCPGHYSKMIPFTGVPVLLLRSRISMHQQPSLPRKTPPCSFSPHLQAGRSFEQHEQHDGLGDKPTEGKALLLHFAAANYGKMLGSGSAKKLP